MTIKFLLRSKKESSNIYLRMSVSRSQVYKRKTGLVVDPENWNYKKGLPKDKNLALTLKELSAKVEKKYNEATTEGKYITAHWLEEAISGKAETLTVQQHTDYIVKTAHKRKNHKGGIGLSDGRIFIYQTFKNLLDRYQKNVSLLDVDRKFSNRFYDWLYEQGYSPNYITKNIEILKTICRDARSLGLKVSNELDKIDSVRQKKAPEAILILSPEEQRTIAELKDLSNYLKNARKWLLLGCLVGQRGGDLLNLSQKKIVTIQNNDFFEIVQEKTGKKIVIPIIPEAKKYVKNMPHKISLQKFNQYIKLICKKAELNEPVIGFKRQAIGGSSYGKYPKWEMMASHVCRRSFATNYYGKIPTPILMSITGHSTEEMFLRYIGKTAYDNAMQMLGYFS